jgi:hypothetical protein
MVIPQSSTCDYEATVEEIRENETIWSARDRLSGGKRLAGRAPRICVDQKRVAITAQSSEDATCRQVVFPAGDAVFKAVKHGDRLFVACTLCATFGVSLIRDDELVLAFGSVTYVPLGTTVNVVRGPELTRSDYEPLDDTWIEVSSGGNTNRVRSRQVQSVGAYEVYLERSWNLGVPGDDEQASIAIAAVDGLPIAAMRSAILLANTRGGCKWVGRK